MSIVQRIQELSSLKNTTLVGLERTLGLGRGTIRNWDKNSPSIDKLQKVAEYFDTSIDSIVYNTEQQKHSQLDEIIIKLNSLPPEKREAIFNLIKSI